MYLNINIIRFNKTESWHSNYIFKRNVKDYLSPFTVSQRLWTSRAQARNETRTSQFMLHTSECQCVLKFWACSGPKHSCISSTLSTLTLAFFSLLNKQGCSEMFRFSPHSCCMELSSWFNWQTSGLSLVTSCRLTLCGTDWGCGYMLENE